MSAGTPYFGIDFGTTNSSMAWCDPENGRADILLNAEGEEKTPSVVYFGEDDEVIVGKYAEEKLKEVENSPDPEEREDVAQRIVRSIKRNLLAPPVIPIPGGKLVRPVEVVARILGKLKDDAQEEHFGGEEIERVVITCPATFGAQQRQVIFDAAGMVGFGRVELLEEPTAAAFTVTKQGQKVGKGVLIYDLGAGTFDLSVVVRDDDGTFRVAMEPDGDPRCGGDDLDLALYEHCEGIAQEQLGRRISLTGDVDEVFLRQCRSRKENLSYGKTSKFSSYLSSGDRSQRFKYEVSREAFEGLIEPRIEGTVRMTARLWSEVKDRAEAVVLIGGSSRVPLVERMLRDTLDEKPRNFAGKDYAVALGAAYRAYELWKEKPGPHREVEKPEVEEYRRAVHSCWNDRWLTRTEVGWLANLAKRELKLAPEVAAGVERQVMGDTVQGVLARQEPVARRRYREILRLGWKDRKLDSLRRVPRARLDMLLDDQDRFRGFDFADCPVSAAERGEMVGGLPWPLFVMAVRVVADPDLNTVAVADRLDAVADELGLSEAQARETERDVLGTSSLEEFLKRRDQEALRSALQVYRQALIRAWRSGRLSHQSVNELKASARRLGLSKEQAENAERSVMRGTAYEILAEDNQVDQLIARHKIARSHIKGSGKNGRITKRDVERHVNEKEAEERKDQERKVRAREVREQRPKPQVQPGALSSMLDTLGEGFVADCSNQAKAFMDADPKWSEKPEKLGGCFASAIKSYETRVTTAVRSKAKHLAPDLQVPRFSATRPGTEISVRKSNAAKVGAVLGGVTVFVGDPGIVGPLIGGAVGGALGKLFGADPRQKTLEAVQQTARAAVPNLRKEAEKYVKEVNGLLAR